MLNTIYQNASNYFKSLDIYSKIITVGLLIIGTLNLIDFFTTFGIFNILITVLDYGVVYWGYSIYAKRINEEKKSSGSSFEA